MIAVEEALARVLALAVPLPCEEVPLRAALGRVMAAPARAGLDQPPFAASAMDGYWADAQDLAPGARLPVAGEAGAGRPFAGEVPRGACLRIFTGAPVPRGGGAVLLQEDVTREGEAIRLPERLPEGRNIRPAGGDFGAGDSFCPARRLTARDIGLLAAMNVPQVEVRRRPRVAVLATGDELVLPGEVPGPGQILSSNSFSLAATIEAAGGSADLLPIARDTEASLRAGFAAAAGADLIVTSGGASVGDHDLVGKVAADLGMERAFWKIAMRPGKPLMAGRLGGVPLLGLPGNPVSALVCAELFLKPLLGAMQGLAAAPARLRARLAAPLGPNGPRRHYMRARLLPGDGLPRVEAFADQDSALLGVMARADVLLIRPEHDAARGAGDLVDCLPLD